MKRLLLGVCSVAVLSACGGGGGSSSGSGAAAPGVNTGNDSSYLQNDFLPLVAGAGWVMQDRAGSESRYVARRVTSGGAGDGEFAFDYYYKPANDANATSKNQLFTGYVRSTKTGILISKYTGSIPFQAGQVTATLTAIEFSSPINISASARDVRIQAKISYKVGFITSSRDIPVTITVGVSDEIGDSVEPLLRTWSGYPLRRMQLRMVFNISDVFPGNDDIYITDLRYALKGYGIVFHKIVLKDAASDAYGAKFQPIGLPQPIVYDIAANTTDPALRGSDNRITVNGAPLPANEYTIANQSDIDALSWLSVTPTVNSDAYTVNAQFGSDLPSNSAVNVVYTKRQGENTQLPVSVVLIKAP